MIHRSSRHALRAVAMLACATLLSGCLTMKSYVDPALPVVGRGDVGAPATPRPVQIATEFRSNGAANAAATAEVQPRVLMVASESGVFSQVSREPLGAGAGLLTVVIDNQADTGAAVGKGFGTGLTLGAVGSLVTDRYVCTMTYTRGDRTTSVDVQHALHTTIGNKSGPEGLAPMTPQEAIHQVIDQLVWNGLRQLREQGALE